MGARTPTEKPPARLIEQFRAVFREDPEFLVRAPGRVDLIGTHTDYNEGWVLPAAITRYAWLAVRELPTALITLHALDMDEQVAFRLTDLEDRKALNGQPLPRWAQYAAGVAWSLQEAGLATPGSQIMITSDVPVGAGLSSSAAVEVAYATAWAHIVGWKVDRMKLAQLCQRAENEYVGVNSGLMDQFTSLHGKPGHALLFDCRTLEWEALPLPEDISLVVADTGTRRQLTDSLYNQRRAECEQAVQALREYLPDISALRDVTVEQFTAYRDRLEEPIRQRAEHIIHENARVLAAAEALKRGDVITLGRLLDESHLSARDLFEASGPELDAMWEASQGHPARLGGRFIGAGWAGCLVFLAKAGAAEDFAAYTARRYEERTGISPSMSHMRTAGGAEVLEDWA